MRPDPRVHVGDGRLPDHISLLGKGFEQDTMGHSVIGIEIGYFIRDIVVQLTTSGGGGNRTRVRQLLHEHSPSAANGKFSRIDLSLAPDRFLSSLKFPIHKVNTREW